MEVVWTRAFAPVLKTQVYSFALIVAAYLAATFAGSYWYRSDYRRGRPRNSVALLAWVCGAALLPVLANDVRWLRIVFWDPTPHLPSTLLLLASICPFCALLGYLTPSLIDHHASGSPQPAGLAYAVNVAGCILGPLLASYLLLPFMSEKHALVLLSLPLFGLFFVGMRRLPRPTLLRTAPLNIAVFALALWWTTSFEDAVRHPANRAYVKRDHAASVVASAAGGEKSLLVNGFGMTKLTPITKCMTHMPLAFLKEPPQSALVICFVLAGVANLIGLAPIVGAFAAGLLLEEVHYSDFREHGIDHTVEHLVEPIAALLVPVFFVQMGMTVDLTTFGNVQVLGFASLLTLVAILGKQVLTLMGDGGFGISAMDMETLVRYRLPAVVVLMNNSSWASVAAGHDAFYPDMGSWENTPGIRYDRMIAELGCHVEHCTTADSITPALERAFASGKTSLVHVLGDTDEIHPLRLRICWGDAWTRGDLDKLPQAAKELLRRNATASSLRRVHKYCIDNGIDIPIQELDAMADFPMEKLA